MKNKTLQLTRAAVIAALYIVLTFISYALSLSSGTIQLRLSESLSVISVFTPAGIYGCTIGCLISNILTGACPLDIVFGSVATLLGAVGTRLIGRKIKWLAPFPTIISNTIIIPLVLRFGYGFKPLPLLFITVFIGEFLSCFVIGMPLYFLLRKNKRLLGLDS